MRRKVLVLLVGVLVASSAIVGVALAAQKASSSTSARVLPKHINPTSIKSAKYKWNVKGTVSYGKYCPNGQSVYPYCSTLPKSAACKGKISWTASLGKNPLLKKSNKKIGSGSTSVSGKCTYAFSHKFPTSDFIADRKLGGQSANRHVGVIFQITFKGNTYLNGSSARRQVIIAKVLEQGT